MASDNVQRLLSRSRIEQGLWTSATWCQRVLMILGGLLVVMACHLLGSNEDFFILRGREVAAAKRSLVEVPCHGAALWSSVEKGSFVHLQNCEVIGQNFSLDTLGLSILYAFRESLPATSFVGSWFRVNVERYADDGLWHPIREVDNLRQISVLAHGVRIGALPLSETLVASMPGTTVPIVQSFDYKPREGAAGALGARNMMAHEMKLYSGNPQWPRQGDVRVWFAVGDAQRGSALAEWSGSELDMWSPPGMADDFERQRKLGIVASGTVSAQALLSKIAPFSTAAVWPVRGVGLLILWCGFSLLLFPNHIVPDFCGACCCCRSFPCALVTAALVGGLCTLYFYAALLATVIGVSVVVALVAVSWDVDARAVRRKLRRFGRRVRGRKNTAGQPMLALEFSTDTPIGAFQERNGVSRTIRVAAMATAIGIIMAGPVVRSLALVDLFGDYYDAFRLNS
mmetsp:Transcript_112917/g.326176  ORF Transcript_112917/g.326176 Transcript_112917/m.326176 type:complete len:456 (-) Transcript_112917:49-1416(-)